MNKNNEREPNVDDAMTMAMPQNDERKRPDEKRDGGLEVFPMRFSPMVRLTTRTDVNTHYYYFTESLPHTNLKTRGTLGSSEQSTPAQPNADASRQYNRCV
jgi:hypothetical protein